MIERMNAERAAATEKARQAVRDAMRDPDSVQFRDEKWNAGTLALCGEFNAKNAMGGYVGYTPFVVPTKGGLPVEVLLRDARGFKYEFEKSCT